MHNRGYAVRMTSPGSETDPSTEAVEAEFPRWRCFRGLGGLYYARRLNTSPAILVRDENTTELRAQIRAKEDAIADQATGFRWPR